MLSELGKGIFLVTPDVPLTFPYGNCLYLDDDRPAVIDLGAGRNAFSAIPADHVELVILSHYHFDHTHCLPLFPQAAIYAGEEEQTFYHDEIEYMNGTGIDLWQDFMPGIACPPFDSVVSFTNDVPSRHGFIKTDLAGTFSDGDEYDLGSLKLRLIHLPGHSCGHYGVYLERDNILFSGDIDLASTGPFYGNTNSDVDSLIESVRRIKELNPRILVTSHRKVYTENIHKRLDRFIQVVLDREDQICEILKKDHSVDELSRYPLGFPNPRHNWEAMFFKVCIYNHILRLISNGLVEEIESGRYLRKS